MIPLLTGFCVPSPPWAQAGVGAVATQSFVRIAYGPEGLEAYHTYEADLKKAAHEARKVFHALRKDATNVFRNKFPEGKLPDTPDEESDE